MNFKINQDNTKVEINVPDNVVEIIYQEVKNRESHNQNDLIGNIQIRHGYEDAIDFLNNNYTKFSVNRIQDPYIRFADKNVEQILINYLTDHNYHCDGIGLTQYDVNQFDKGYMFDTIRGKTNITRFPELNRFTNFKKMDGGSFENCTNLEEVNLTNIISITGSKCFQNTKLTTVDLSNCTSITGASIFYGCTSLITVNAPQITTLSYEAFSGCTSLTTLNIDWENLTSVGAYGLYNCQNLIIPKIENIETIAGYAFYNCKNLIEIDLKNCTQLLNHCFYGCSSLTTLGDLSNITKIETAALQGCTSLTSLGNLPNNIEIGCDSTFGECENLEGTLDLSNCTVQNNGVLIGTFRNCKKLTRILLGNINSIGGRWNVFENGRKAFHNCTSLHTIDVKNLTKVINDWAAINNCPNLQNFIIRNTTDIPQLDDCTAISMNAFGGTNVKIYVPDEMVDVYKTDSIWMAIENYIYPLSEYVPIED